MESNGADETKSYWLNDVHAFKNLGLPKQAVNVNELITNYQHINGIPLKSLWNAEPMLLIGTNNWKLAVPRKIREG